MQSHQVYIRKFKDGDTVKFIDQPIDYNDPYSNLFTEKTFVIRGLPSWNYQYCDWQYDFQTNKSNRFLLQKLLEGVYRS